MAVVLAALLMTASGCDTAGAEGDDTLLLQPQDVTFRFQFDGGGSGAGRLVGPSEQSVDLADVLPLGYGTQDVRRVTVTEVILERIQPLDALSEYLEAATLAVDGVGEPQLVARLDDPPAARSAEMTISAASIGSSVIDQPFSGILQADLLSRDAPAYVFEVQMTIQIEVLDV